MVHEKPRLAVALEADFPISQEWLIPGAIPFRASDVLGALQEVELGFKDFSTGPTLFEEDVSLPGKFGFRLRHVAKRPPTHDHDPATWFSGYAFDESDVAPQGDPRTIAAIVSPNVAYVLGIASIDANSAVLPEGPEFAGRLRALDDVLPKLGYERLPVLFESTDEKNPILSPKKNVENFAYRGWLPVGMRGRALFHDLSYHASAIFLPPEYVRQARRFFRRMADFLEYVDQIRHSDPSLDWIDDQAMDRIYAWLSSRIDLGSSNYRLRYVQRFDSKLNGLVDWTNGLMNAMYDFGAFDKSADETLKTFFFRNPLPIEKRLNIDNFSESGEWSPYWKADPSSKSRKLNRMIRLAWEFCESHKSAEMREVTWLYEPEPGEKSPNWHFQTEGLLDRISDRRAELDEAAKFLLKAR